MAGRAISSVAISSLRYRRGGFVASFLTVFLGAGILMSFASMLDVAGQSGVSKDNRSTLSIMAFVVGGWGAIIVASAVATTLSVTTRQRATELALLRSVGATPRQVIRLITAEAALVSLGAVLLAVPVGIGGGYLLLHLLKNTGQISDGVGFRAGGAAFGLGLGLTYVAALFATWLTARRAARRRVQDALLNAAVGGRRASRTRIVTGGLFVLVGINCGVMTATTLKHGDVNTLQSVAAEAAILSSIGFALLAPVIVAAVTRVFGPVVRALGGAPGYLGTLNLRQRAQQAATPLMPIVVLTGMATGTLYMQAITNSVHRHTPGSSTADDKGVETLNYVVVGMIAVFAAVMLVNLLVATISERRREFAQERLIGATPSQIRWVVLTENIVLVIVGLLLGSIAAALTVVPFSLAKTNKVVPDAGVGSYLAIVGGVVVLTIGAALAAVRRTGRGAAITQLTAAAS
jgi:putative ABC transport system permease protein